MLVAMRRVSGEFIRFGVRSGNLRGPADSNLLAMSTLSPNRQYRGILLPTTPATTAPDHKKIKHNVSQTSDTNFSLDRGLASQ